MFDVLTTHNNGEVEFETSAPVSVGDEIRILSEPHIVLSVSKIRYGWRVIAFPKDKLK